MKISEIKKQAAEAKKEGIILYYAYMNQKDGSEKLVSNFDKSEKISDNYLIKLIEKGIVKQDWDVYEVIA